MEESRRSFLKKTAAAGSAAIAVPAIISASAFGSNATEGEQGHGKSHQKSMKSTSKPSFMIRHTVAFKLKYPIGSAEEKEFLAAGALSCQRFMRCLILNPCVKRARKTILNMVFPWSLNQWTPTKGITKMPTTLSSFRHTG